MDEAARKQRGQYADLIDAETWAFIDKTNASYPENAVDLSIPQQRQLYDAMCKQFRVARPDGVTAVDTAIVTTTHCLPIREYRFAGAQPQAQILYFHGGGFLVGGLDSHDDVCAQLCAGTGLKVVSVDYRLAPEHVFPAAYADAVAAYHFVTQAPQQTAEAATPKAVADLGSSPQDAQNKAALPVILAGDSAGANLAASLAHSARTFAIQPIGQVLIYPGLTHDLSAPAYVEHAHAPLLSTADIECYRDWVTGGVDRSQDPRCAPLADTDFADLPATHVFAAGCDPLLDDGREYCEKIIAAGGRAYFTEEAGLVHGYLRARHSVKRARDSFERMVQACNTVVDAMS